MGRRRGVGGSTTFSSLVATQATWALLQCGLGTRLHISADITTHVTAHDTHLAPEQESELLQPYMHAG